MLCPLARHFIRCLALGRPRKTRFDMTEKLLTGTLRIKPFPKKSEREREREREREIQAVRPGEYCLRVLMYVCTVYMAGYPSVTGL